MGALKLDGDLSQIDEAQLNYIQNRLQDLGYENDKVIVEPVGKAGDNYAASVKRIIINKEDGKTVKMIAKIAPQHPASREIMDIETMFQNEFIMYLEVFPTFTELEKNAEIPEVDRFKYPTCLGSFTEAPHEVLLLEDMTGNNYETKDKMTPLDDATIRILLKTFAHFHSLSYALKNKDIKKFESFHKLIHFWESFEKKEHYKLVFTGLEQHVMSLLDNEEAKNRCTGFLKNLAENNLTLSKSDIYSKQSVIVQGDCWTNNFLFKTEEGAATSCILIDYQLSRVSNPAADLLYLIFSCTDYETRKKHFHGWLDYYYSELGKALFNFGLKAQDELPYDKFDADLRRYGKALLGFVTFALMTTLRQKSEVVDLKSDFENAQPEEIANAMGVKHLTQETKERIVMRVRGGVASAIDFGLI